MARLQKLAVTARDAAKMLSLALHDFLSLVEAGALPQPVFLGKHQLWIVSEIEAVLTGRNIEQEVFVV